MRYGLKVLALVSVLPLSMAHAQTYIPLETATLRALDKITGRSTDIDVRVGEPIVFGSLTVELKACYQTPPEEPPESAAFLQVRTQQAIATATDGQVQTSADAADKPELPPVFSGWMFASSPGLSALEHPVYDVWVIHCTASAPDSGTSESRSPSE